ncbi:outer membrane protein assembly factor BamB family protein [Nocardioides sp. Root140]|uniref:outer membrane protein assembly factor BamB family protein n=1 Tax=Nocardioides sp. Root140 TaxID=1736460 RepID=UPI0009ECADD5|nr:PQQ-binding-like beta-propeller repeat protein [Nocardioides sp. Root140]
MSLRMLRAGLATVVALTVALSGCSSTDDKKDDSSKVSLPDPLEPAWVAKATETTFGVAVFRRGDRLLQVSQESVTALDPASGDVVWNRPIPQGCSAGEPNAAGDVVVVFGEGCRDVVVIDSEKGTARWRAHIPSISKQYDSGNVVASIGDRTVTVIQFCGQVTRLSLKDGHRLGVLSPHDVACANEADSDGQVIAVWHDPATEATPDDHGTGFIPPWDGAASFELYDADSGKLLWRRTRSRQDSGLDAGAVVSSSPLILALREDGHTLMRRYSRAHGRPGATVGLQLGAYRGFFTPLGTADGVMVGTYDTSPKSPTGTPRRVYAYDVKTGRELWSRAVSANTLSPHYASSAVAGVDSEGVVVTERRMRDDGRSFEIWLARWNLRTGEDAGTAGRIDEDESQAVIWQVSDGLLLGQGRGTLEAYELEAVDPDVKLPGTEPAWAEGDVRPDPMSEPCAEVSRQTLRTLGLRASAALPAPANCTWTETAEPRYSDRSLRVSVHVARPTESTDEEGQPKTMPAVDGARAVAAQWRKEFNPDLTGGILHPGLGAPHEVDGLGDEAYATSGTRFAGSIGVTTGSYLLVRAGNVVVEVQAEGGYDVAHPQATPPSLNRIETGTLAAAREVLASLGVTLDATERPDPGRVRRVGDVCAVLRADAEALGLPAGHSVTPPGADPRLADCAWEQDDSIGDLAVHVYAAGGNPLDGDSASTVARKVFAASRSRDDKPLRGLGEKAVISRWDQTEAADGYDLSEREVLLVVDNLVIELSYSRDGAGLGEQVERDALRMTRKVLDATRK